MGQRGENKVKKLKRFAVKIIEAVIIGGSAWDYIKKIFQGLSTKEISFNTMTVTDLGSFLFFDWFWLILIGYGLIHLIPFVYKKIQQANAERKRKISEQRKQEIREVLQENG